MTRLSIDMKYPEELVHKYGAKAGFLMYVKQHLPEIPQVDMVVKTPEDSLEEFVDKVYQHPILFPILVRSSAVEELLVGSEGQFPTSTVYGSCRSSLSSDRGSAEDRADVKRNLTSIIEAIENSPQRLDEYALGNLPEKICVIAAEVSPSSYKGTLIKHPNQENTYWLTITDDEAELDRLHLELIYSEKQGLRKIFQHNYFFDKALHTIFADALKVIAWHDKISALDEIDSAWTYQLEFGIDPVCLYQVRPFKKIEKANFSLPECDEDYPAPLVLGITDKKGIDVRVVNKIWDKRQNGQPINPNNEPYAHVDKLRMASHSDEFPNLQVNLFNDYFGFLAHEDVRAMRLAQVTGLYPCNFNFKAEHGDWINVKSDGKNIQVKKIKGMSK